MMLPPAKRMTTMVVPASVRPSGLVLVLVRRDMSVSLRLVGVTLALVAV
jgi:hypothetical protein